MATVFFRKKYALSPLFWYEHDYISKAVTKPELLSVIHVLKFAALKKYVEFFAMKFTQKNLIYSSIQKYCYAI